MPIKNNIMRLFKTSRVLKKALIPVFLFFIFGSVCAQTSFSRGEVLFLENKPREALVYLEAAAAENPANTRAFLYLGIAYEQLSRGDEAIAVFKRILPQAGENTANVAFNLGNAYFKKGDTSHAEEYYTQAIKTDPAYASAYLNRANTRVKNSSLKEALGDYEKFLSLEPLTPKRPQIESLTSLIRAEFAAEEQRRIMAEAAVREEAERRQRLLDEVSASLQSAVEDIRSMSAGSESVKDYHGEFKLE